MTPIPLLTEQPLGTSVVLHYPQGQEKQVSMGTFAGVSEYYQFESVYSSLTHHSSSGSSLGRASDGIIGWHTAYVKDGLRRGELFGSVKLNKPDSLLAKLLTNPWMLTSPRHLPQEAVNKTLSEAPSVDLSLELPQIREQEILEGQRLSLGIFVKYLTYR